MANYTIKPYTSDQKDTWDDCVGRSLNGTFLHRRDYMDYHADRYPDVSRMVVKGNDVVAVFPAAQPIESIISHAGLTYGGLLVDSSVNSGDVASVLDSIAESYNPNLAGRILVKPVPSIYHWTVQEAELAWLAQHGRIVHRALSTVIDQRQRLGNTPARTRHLNKARQVGVCCCHCTVADAYPIVAATLDARHGLKPVHAESELQGLAARFSHHIRCWAAYLDNRPIAAVVLYLTRTVAHIQYVGQTERSMEVRAQDFLLDFLIGYYRAHRYFDFGVSTEPDGSLNEGLLAYKESFGGRTVCYDTWEVTA